MRWEIQVAEKRLREAGYARVDEVLIFEAVEEMRRLEQESEHKTKKARRAREMRHGLRTSPPQLRRNLAPSPQLSKPIRMRRESKPSKASWSQNDMNGEHLSPKTRELLDRPMEERIAHIQKDSWIPYSQANRILQQLQDLLHHPKCDRIPNLAISCNDGVQFPPTLLKEAKSVSPNAIILTKLVTIGNSKTLMTSRFM